jgi:hypothetical protein
MALVRVGGILVNQAPMVAKFDTSASTLTIPTNQAIYLGTFWANGAGAVTMRLNPAPASGGGLPIFGLWNAYNRVQMKARNVDNGASYTMSSSAVRGARNSVNNACWVVTGQAYDTISVLYNFASQTVAVNGSYVTHSILLDVVGVTQGVMNYSNAAALMVAVQSETAILPPVFGYHSIAMGENSDGTNLNLLDRGNADSLHVGFWC